MKTPAIVLILLLFALIFAYQYVNKNIVTTEQTTVRTTTTTNKILPNTQEVCPQISDIDLAFEQKPSFIFSDMFTGDSPLEFSSNTPKVTIPN